MTTPEPVKRCYRCGEEKPLDDFHRDRSRKDGRNARCMDCVRGYHAVWYHRNRGQVRPLQAAYYAGNQTWISEARAVARAEASPHVTPRAELPRMEWPKPAPVERIEWDLPPVDHEAARDRALEAV